MKFGFQGKAYKSSAVLDGTNTPAAATWALIANIKDVTVTSSGTEVDVTTRANNGYKQTGVALIDGSVDFSMPWDLTDTILAAIKAAYHARSEIGLAFMDGAIATSGSNGFASNWMVTKFERGELLEGEMMANITVKISSYTQDYTKA